MINKKKRGEINIFRPNQSFDKMKPECETLSTCIWLACIVRTLAFPYPRVY